MEYTISGFVDRLRGLMKDEFPYLEGRGFNKSGTPKHKDHNDEIRKVAFERNPTVIVDENTLTFDIGNEYAETYYPYYHILEDAPVIRKRYRSTEKTRGSQANIKELGKRDYGRINFNGKTYSREYARNIRGERNKVVQNAQQNVYVGNEKFVINKSANSYKNEHYHYIENMLEKIVPIIAGEFGLGIGRKQITDLSDEFKEQTEADIVSNIFSSMD